MNIVRLFLFSIFVVCVVLGYPDYYSDQGTRVYANYYQNPRNLYEFNQGVGHGRFHSTNFQLGQGGLKHHVIPAYPANQYQHKQSGEHVVLPAYPQDQHKHKHVIEHEYYPAHQREPYQHKHGVEQVPFPSYKKPLYGPPAPYGAYGGMQYGYGYGYGLPARSGGILGTMVTIFGWIFLLFIVIMTFGYFTQRGGYQSKKVIYKHGAHTYRKPVTLPSPTVPSRLPIIIITGTGTVVNGTTGTSTTGTGTTGTTSDDSGDESDDN